MTATPRSLPLTALETAVLETVVYSDVFDFPVTAEEVWRGLPLAASLEDVSATLSSRPVMPSLASAPAPYFVLKGRDELVALRRRRAESSAALRRRAEAYGAWIARLPFVRMVAITGSLAVENSPVGDDIDYLIVTVPGRLWLTRALTMLVVRFARLRGVTLCPNYFLAESALTLAEGDYYTARELRQMQPLSGADVYGRLLAANAWWHDFLPNAEVPSTAAIKSNRPSLLRSATERVLGMGWADALERALLHRKGRELRGQADGNDEAVFSESVCKGHFEGYRSRTRDAIAQRLRGLEETQP